MKIEEILAAFGGDCQPFPRAAVEAAVAQRAAITPHLLRRLDELAADPGDFISGDGNEHMFAMYLLAEFRERAAFPAVMGLLRAAGPRLKELMGPDLDDGLQRVLASVCGGDPDLLREVVEDEAAEDRLRGVALDALLALGFDGVVSRERVLAYLRGWIQGDGIGDRYSFLRCSAAEAAMAFEAEELLPDLVRAQNEGAGIFSLGDDVDADEIRLRMYSPPWDYSECHRLVRRALDELKMPTVLRYEPWMDGPDCMERLAAILEPPGEPPGEPRVALPRPTVEPLVAGPTPGRNDPCPCGSGKKYKRCCG